MVVSLPGMLISRREVIISAFTARWLCIFLKCSCVSVFLSERASIMITSRCFLSMYFTSAGGMVLLGSQAVNRCMMVVKRSLVSESINTGIPVFVYCPVLFNCCISQWPRATARVVL